MLCLQEAFFLETIFHEKMTSTVRLLYPGAGLEELHVERPAELVAVKAEVAQVPELPQDPRGQPADEVVVAQVQPHHHAVRKAQVVLHNLCAGLALDGDNEDASGPQRVAPFQPPLQPAAVHEPRSHAHELVLFAAGKRGV